MIRLSPTVQISTLNRISDGSLRAFYSICDLPDLEAAMEADDGPSDVSVHFVRLQASRLAFPNRGSRFAAPQ
jgi:hypothetical protein